MFKKFSDWNSHTLTTNSKGGGCLISGANTTENQWLYTVVFVFPRAALHTGSVSTGGTRPQGSFARKTDGAVPCSHGVPQQMLTLAWK